MANKKSKIVSMGCALALLFGVTNVSLDTHAMEIRKKIDGSYLTHEQESIVKMVRKSKRGADLLAGYSKCLILANGDFLAGGTTIAASTVERIGIGVTIERATADEEGWEFYDGWVKFDENTDAISSNARYNPEGGYYYRVRCTHSANDDVSSSFTNGIYVE